MTPGPSPTSVPLLQVRDLSVVYPVGRKQTLEAVVDISFDLHQGETLALVGESGCGKSSTGRALARLPPPTGGTVELGGVDVNRLPAAERRQVHQQIQLIFQDPISSLNPRRTVRQIVEEPLRIWGHDRARASTDAMLESVGLEPAEFSHRRPQEMSGGQCQRVAIARALMLRPRILICDEPVSALDVSVQAQILNLLNDLKSQFALTSIFISHDLGAVRAVADRVAVMYLGTICETGPIDEVYDLPAHPYTRALLDAVPIPDPQAREHGELLVGDLPSPTTPPSGCRFRTRCPQAQDLCAAETPRLRPLRRNNLHEVACHFPLGQPVSLVEPLRNDRLVPSSKALSGS